MGLEVVSSQVHAIAQLIQSLGGQVSAAQRSAVGNAGALMGGARLMLADALRLVALLEQEGLEDYDWEPLFEGELHNFAPMEMLLAQAEERQGEAERLRDQLGALEQMMGLLQEQIGAVLGLIASVEAMAQQQEAKDPVLQQLLDVLRNSVLPELQELIARLQDAQDRLREAVAAREDEIDYLETAFKFILPWLRAVQQQRRLRLQEARAAQEAAASKPADLGQKQADAPGPLASSAGPASAEQATEPPAARHDPQEEERLRQQALQAITQRGKRLGPGARKALERVLGAAVRDLDIPPKSDQDGVEPR